MVLEVMGPQHAVARRFRGQVDPLIGQARDDLARQSGIIGGCRVVSRTAWRSSSVKAWEGAGRTAAGRPSARTAPPWVQRCQVRAVMPSTPQDGFKRAPAAWASSISDTARRRSGVLSMRPRPPLRAPGLFLTGSTARRFRPALSPCAVVHVSVSAPSYVHHDPPRPAAGHAHRPSPSRTHRPFARR